MKYINKKLLNYLDFEIIDNKIEVSETLEYYISDTYSKEEFKEFINKLENLYNKLK